MFFPLQGHISRKIIGDSFLKALIGLFLCQVAKLRFSYLPDDAYKAVMWDKKVGEKRVESQQTQQQRLEAKKKANVVSPQSVSPATQPPPKESYEEELRRRMNTEWDGNL